jgi:hypothetical protein
MSSPNGIWLPQQRLRLPWLVALAAGLLGLAWAGAGWRPARAQSGITILETPPPEYEFGQQITFEMSAHSAEPIVNALLYWESPGWPPTVWPQAQFQPGTHFSATAQFDLARYPLPAFAPISFWWVVEDATGTTQTSAVRVFQYEDNRYDWQQLNSGALTVHWYEGGADFGEAALDVATHALPRINRDIRAPLPARVDLYIYAHREDEQAALQRIGRAWADGHADPELGVIIVAVAPDLRFEFGLQREIPHEMTHVLVYHVTEDQYERVPVWLNEGLAVMNQGQRDTQFPALLAAARDAQAFRDLAQLCGTLPAESEAARLAYAQSESVVRYLRARFGSEGIYNLLQAYGAGADCDLGVRSALGLGLAEVQAAWLRDVIYAGASTAAPGAMAPWLVVAGLVLLALVVVLLVVLGASRATRQPQRGGVL